MSKRLELFTLIISLAAIILSVVSITLKAPISDSAQLEDTQYVLYLGTNDKDTNEPVFTPEEAAEHAKSILIDHFGGYTIQDANGGWVDGNKLYQEYTLVIHLSDTTLKDVHEACDELIKEFNQSSILIQSNHTTTEFYSGS